MTIEDALKIGIKIGDIVMFEWSIFEFQVIDIGSCGTVNVLNTDTFESIVLQNKNEHITFKPYTPAHNELCTILTKNGLGTKAIAVHYNGKISAISIDKEGNADCHFKAEQIEKFFKLPE